MTTTTITDVKYGSLPGQRLDLIVPFPMLHTVPCVVIIHDGNWAGKGHVFGNLEIEPIRQMCRQADMASVCLDYTGSRTTWTQQVNDAQLAIRFLRTNKSTYHLNGDVAVFGLGAAGGLVALWLASLQSTMAGDMADLYSTQSPVISAAVIESGAVAPPTANQDFDDTGKAAFDLTRAAAPCPIFFSHGIGDAVAPYAATLQLVDRLKNKGVHCVLASYNGGHLYAGASTQDQEIIHAQMKTFLTAHMVGQFAFMAAVEDAADQALLVGNTEPAGHMHAVESFDLMAMTGSIPPLGHMAAVESPDVAVIAGQLPLPSFGHVSSAGVFNSDNKLVRTLWSAQTDDPRVANPASAWDGTLDDGTVAPTGTYHVKILSNDCVYSWDGVVGNSSPTAEHIKKVTYINPGAPIYDMEITPGPAIAAGLLLHMDGTDGSQVFTDSSGRNHTVTAHGNAQIDTAQSAFGGASALFDGIGDYLSLDGHADFALGTGAFTIDLVFRLAPFNQWTDAIGTLICFGASAPTLKVYVDNDGTRGTLYLGNGSTVLGQVGGLLPGYFYHVSVLRGDDASATCFLNGSVHFSDRTDNNNYTIASNYPLIGADAGGTNCFCGHIDELRVIKGYRAWSTYYNYRPWFPYPGGSELYFTSAYHEKFGTVHYMSPDDIQVTDWIGDAYGWAHNICTDGTLVYISFYGNPTTSIMGWRCDTKHVVLFEHGDQWGHIGINSEGVHYVTSMAVQRATGGFLFVAMAIASGNAIIMVIDKTTGETLHTYTGISEPVQVATNPVNGDLWVSYTYGGVYSGRIVKCTVDGSGNITQTAVVITGLQGVQSMDVSPDGNTLLVCDAGTSQQVKAFNTSDGSVKTAWATNGVLGQANGYANGPAITDDKFMFVGYCPFTGVSAPSYIAHAPDGSFWLGDPGCNRNLHFSAGNSPTVTERFAYLPASYSCQVCANDDTRVFSGWLEYEVDYSKTLDADNGSWTLTNNWGYIFTQHPEYINDQAVLGRVGTYSGRTYVWIYNPNGFNRIYEMTASGLRDTEVDVWVWLGIDKDLNLYYYQVDTHTVGVITRNTFTGFDSSNNPTWEYPNNVAWPAWVYAQPPWLTTEQTPVGFPTMEVNRFGNRLDTTANGVWPYYNGHSSDEWHGTEHHLGGVELATGKVKYMTHPPTHGVGYGFPEAGNELLIYPQAPYFQLAGGSGCGDNGGAMLLWRPGRTDIFTNYRGELWGGGQTNRWDHWHESGLLVGQWGTVGPYYAAGFQVNEQENWQAGDWGSEEIQPPSIVWTHKGLPGHSGNSASGGIAYQNGKYYIYHNDEWIHAGIHRHCVDGLSTISLVATQVNWDQNDYVEPEADPNDLLAGLPFNTYHIADNTAGWHRDIEDYESSPAGQFIRTRTNVVQADRRQSPDLALALTYDNAGGEATLYKAIPRVGTGDWNLEIVPQWKRQGDWGYGGEGCILLMEVLDATGKVIVRVGLYRRAIYGQSGPTQTGNAFWVNEHFSGGAAAVPIGPPSVGYGYGTYATKPRTMLISANVGAATMDISYGAFSATGIPVCDAGADITAPVRFQIRQHNSAGGKSGHAINLHKLYYSEPTPMPRFFMYSGMPMPMVMR